MYAVHLDRNASLLSPQERGFLWILIIVVYIGINSSPFTMKNILQHDDR